MDPTTGVTPFYLDKALWVTLLTPVLAILAQKLGVQLDATEIVGLMLPVVAYIVGHKWKTGTIVAASIAAGSAAGQPAQDQASKNAGTAAAGLK